MRQRESHRRAPAAQPMNATSDLPPCFYLLQETEEDEEDLEALTNGRHQHSQPGEMQNDAAGRDCTHTYTCTHIAHMHAHSTHTRATHIAHANVDGMVLCRKCGRRSFFL